MKKHVYFVDGFSETYEKLKDIRSHIETLSVRDAMDYDGARVFRDGGAYRWIDIRCYSYPRRIVVFRKFPCLELPNDTWWS